ncbi:MAG: Peroxiredoxin [Ignavibacteria bacterium]|nr:MAG: Peroxiredoxin [Ignavibacteria bacterium]KAF0158572.1 MAG: Peroxiredoxin [Ignavibacteria bacterium]
MRKKIVILFLVLTAGFSFAQDDLKETTLINVGDNLPKFTAKALNGNDLTSDELTGKVVLITFWATWCGPCKAEMPFIQKDIYEKINDSNFVIAAISRGEEKEIVKKFIDLNKYPFPIYLDKEAAVYNLFASKYIPRNFVIGKDGKVKWTSVGFKHEEFAEMVNTINDELAK